MLTFCQNSQFPSVNPRGQPDSSFFWTPSLIDINISQLLINIDISQNYHIDIDIDIDYIDIFGIALLISIFSKITISIFFKSVDISTIEISYRYITQSMISLQALKERLNRGIPLDLDDCEFSVTKPQFF